MVQVPEVIYQVLQQPMAEDELKGRSEIPQTLEDFMAEIKESRPNAKTFALKLRDMVVPPLLVLSYSIK